LENLPLIVVEIVMVFGGALAFGWWQMRDLAREREKRETARRQAADASQAETGDR
jgi:cytoskeletal protein RodZ